jgi:adenosyl cobinamide kinase/adenosyl cobinamide phosphate guanylyltransferase
MAETIPFTVIAYHANTDLVVTEWVRADNALDAAKEVQAMEGNEDLIVVDVVENHVHSALASDKLIMPESYTES